MYISQGSETEKEDDLVVVSFSRKDAKEVLAHENDSMVIKVQTYDCSVKRVLVDLGSSVNVLYLDAFNYMTFNMAGQVSTL